MIRTELKSYRAEARDKAIAVMEDGGGFLLCLEQRTGKTQTSLAVAEHFKKRAPYLLIVCPKPALATWNKAVKEELSEGWKEITITNIEQIRARHLQWYKWGNARKGKLQIILDEAHMIKDRGSSQSGRVRTLSRRAAYRQALTGTPIAQGLHDAWAIYDFINPKIFGKYDDTVDKKTKRITAIGFDSRYVIWGGFRDHNIVGYQNEEEFQKKFHDNSYRVTLQEAKKRDGKKGLILHYRKSYFELERKARDIYDGLENDLVAVINKKRIKVKNVLACVTKMQQVTGGFFKEVRYEADKNGNDAAFVKYHLTGREKLEQLHQELRSLQAGTKFLIVCRFIWEIETIYSYLTKMNYDLNIVRGGQPYEGKIRGDGIILQVATGIAVDMSEADSIFYYSMDYSSIKFEQSRFRILSYSKGGVGRYVFMLAKNTVDELIYEAVSRKKKLADLVIDKYRRRG